jgi:hypothetical protein
MRITSTLLGLVLFGLTVSARAQEAPATVDSTRPLNQVEQLDTKPPSSSVGKWQTSVAFLSMGLGKMTQVLKGVREDNDALFAYGLGLAADYRVLRGLTVGFAPQAILNVKAKDSSLNAARQIDLLVRVAYAYPIAEGSRIYAEVLPGYSLIVTDDLSKGLVIAAGAGVTVDVSARTFVNFGIGYQLGFQKFEGDDSRTSYVRAALGGGRRF